MKGSSSEKSFSASPRPVRFNYSADAAPTQRHRSNCRLCRGPPRQGFGMDAEHQVLELNEFKRPNYNEHPDYPEPLPSAHHR